ncbi:hypothetical protein [Lacrimispora amygdalina]|uniref:hypothetical protein n=1 Tax=Lacrimispora amygdalina TaxID=253257 RepID=UPI000BE2B835|nr:hypothetical protein [Lacrimispora amygdalina]
MARQVNYEIKKEKINKELEKLGKNLSKVEESIAAETAKKKEIKRKIQEMETELENVKRQEVVDLIAEKNLSSEELQKIFNDSESK